MSANDTTRFVRQTGIVAARLRADEMALLSAKKGKYYGLNSPATRIWELVETPRTLDEICAVLVAEFDVDDETCRKQSNELLAELMSEGLVATTS